MSDLKIEKVRKALEDRSYVLIELIKNGDSRQIIFSDKDEYKNKINQYLGIAT